MTLQTLLYPPAARGADGATRHRPAGVARQRLLRPLAVLFLAVATFGVFLPDIALADVWHDIADSTWERTYGVSAGDAYGVAQGRSNGTFGPLESVNRGQLAQMAANGLGISTAAPDVATFHDVSESHVFFCAIEECTAAGVMSGYADGSFRPGTRVTREQTCSVLARWLADQEIESRGAIRGSRGTYPTLRIWYEAEGAPYLAGFADAGRVSAAHRITSAYLVSLGVVAGSPSQTASLLNPAATLNRAQAVALVVRAKQAAAALVEQEEQEDTQDLPSVPVGPTAVVLTNGQTPLRGVWSGTAEQLTRFFERVCSEPLFTVPTSALAGYYVRYAAEAGVRADLLWAQMIHETGYGMYGGDVLPEQNNYAGIGATGGVPGYSFATAEAGVMAHVAHMVAYVYTSNPVEWANSSTDPRFDLVSPRGVAAVLADLNGRWAVPGTSYGQSIEAIARTINADQ